MRAFAHPIDRRGAAAGRLMTVLLSVLLALSSLGVVLFADRAVAAEANGAAEVTIADDAVPEVASVSIPDEEVPLGAFDEPRCWVHWVMLAGSVLTLCYGVIAVRSRLELTHEVIALERETLGVADHEAERGIVAGHQAL